MSDAKEQKRLFEEWLENQRRGTKNLKETTVDTYISCMKAAYLKFTDLKKHTSVFEIQDTVELDEYTAKLFNAEGFAELIKRQRNGACKGGFKQYRIFLEEQKSNSDSKKIFSDVLTHNLYGINMTEKNTALSDDDPHISIGWSKLGDLTNINDYETLGALYDEKYTNDKDRTYNLGVVWKMRNTIEIGDYVVYAYGNTFNVGRVTSEYYFDATLNTDQDSDYVNSRKVEWLIKNGNKGQLHQALSNSMIGRGLTIWDMNKYRAAIRELLAGTYQKEKWENKTTATNQVDTNKLVFDTGFVSDSAGNRIIFGAPGTGKSFKLEQERNGLLANGGDYERVTFHPDYSYANFVGTYKPVMVKNDDGKKEISYEYTPGPFLRVLVKALKNAMTNEPKPYLLIIEEINRANVAAVFGDVFQLLDRDADSVSEFAIATSEDMKSYLAEALGVDESKVESIKIPNNMFIWATMNSADQGVYPMDTAFKRRWEFEYLSIDAKQAAIVDWQFKDVRSDAMYSWNNLRKAINDKLIELKVNEDKLLGPFFLKKTDFDSYDKFKAVFSSKVLMYLFEDAARHRHSELFKGCGDKDCNIFSRICDKFETQGVEIFHPDIANQFPVSKPVEQEEQ